MNEGYEKAKAMADKLKAETTVTQEQEQEKMQEAKKELATMRSLSKDAQVFFDAEADEVDDDLGGASLPVLRIHTSQSTNNVLLDGSAPQVGQLFHNGLKIASDEFTVHILKIMQCELEEYGKTGEYKKNYLIAGVLADSNEPFVLYAKGVGYNEVWDLQSQLKPFVKNKQHPVPKYSLYVKITTGLKEPTDKKYKAQYAAMFKVLVDDEGQPYVEANVSKLKWLKASVFQATSACEDIVAKNGKAQVLRPSTRVQPIEEDAAPKLSDQEQFKEDVTEVEDIQDAVDVPF